MVEIMSISVADLIQPGEVGLQESDLLDRMPDGKVEGDTATEQVRLISLGAYCGPKLSFKKIGRGAETLPFDWLRTRLDGVLHFLRNDFEGFYDWSTMQKVPNGMTIYRGYYHSFWHDNPLEDAMRERYDRRIQRFKETDAHSAPVLFVRACAETSELGRSDELLAELKIQFGKYASLLMILDFQSTATGPALVDGHPDLMVWYLSGSIHSEVRDGCPYTEPVKVALDWVVGRQVSCMQFINLDTIVACADATVWGRWGLDGVPAFEDEPCNGTRTIMHMKAPSSSTTVAASASASAGAASDGSSDEQLADASEVTPAEGVEEAEGLGAAGAGEADEVALGSGGASGARAAALACEVAAAEEVAAEIEALSETATAAAASSVPPASSEAAARKPQIDVESDLMEGLSLCYAPVVDGIALISLGCFCGPKLTFQQLGRGSETLPFDWIRSSFDGLLHFIKTDFESFFNYTTRREMPNTHMVMYRSHLHSFWHDNPDSEEMRVKYRRRIARLVGFKNTKSPLLFVRAISSMDELSRAGELLQALKEHFGMQACLLLIADFQRETLGAITVENQEDLLVYFLGAADRGPEGTMAPYGRPTKIAIDWVKGEAFEAGCVSNLPSLRALANPTTAVDLAHFGVADGAFEPAPAPDTEQVAAPADVTTRGLEATAPARQEGMCHQGVWRLLARFTQRACVRQVCLPHPGEFAD